MRLALNPEQRAAVQHGEGPLLVLAGAGSGKTRVLTARAASLVETGGIPPDRILAVTFTNKAAGEMRERIGSLIGRDTRGLWIGTFHSMAARILRREAPRLGRGRAFTIYDEDDSLRAIRDAMEECDYDPRRWSPRSLRARISTAKNACISPSEYAAATYDLMGRAISEVYPVYQRLLTRRNAYDFDDLLSETVRLLEQHEEARSHYADRFLHVLVDEYQDTNHAQYRILKALAGQHGNICAEHSRLRA
jgi:DNA helicase-2/ATP-dependent DNA helicase PcrA